MKLQFVLTSFVLSLSYSALAVTASFDFQNIPVGPLPGGFLTLNVNGVSALFSGFNTAVADDPASGKHILYTSELNGPKGQMGMEFSAAVTEVQITLSGSFPTSGRHLTVVSYYDQNGSLIPIHPITTSGLSLTFTSPPRNTATVMGLLLDGTTGNGFALESVSIQTVPEPSGMAVIGLAVGGLMIGMRRSSF